jgi:hypothetical protein
VRGSAHTKKGPANADPSLGSLPWSLSGAGATSGRVAALLLVGLARLAALLAALLAGLLLAFLALLLLLAGRLALGIVLLLLRIPLVLTTHGVLLFTERAVIGACQVNWRDSGLFRPIARAPESG